MLTTSIFFPPVPDQASIGHTLVCPPQTGGLSSPQLTRSAQSPVHQLNDKFCGMLYLGQYIGMV